MSNGENIEKKTSNAKKVEKKWSKKNGRNKKCRTMKTSNDSLVERKNAENIRI